MISLIRRIFPLLDSRTRRGLVLAVPAAIVLGVLEAAGFSLVFPLVRVFADPAALEGKGLFAEAFDRSGLESRTTFLVIVGSLVFFILLIKSLLSIVYIRWQTRVLSRGEAETAIRLFRQYLFADYAFHIQHHSAGLIRNVQVLVSNMFGRVLLPLSQLMAECFLILAIVVTLFAVDPLAASAATSFLGLTAAIYLRIFGRRSHRFGRADVRLEGVNQRQVQESLGGVKTLHALGCLEPVAEQFETVRRDLAGIRQRQMFAGQLPRYLLETALLVALVMIVVVVLLTRSGAAAVASLGFLAAGSFRLMPSLGRVLTTSNGVSAGRASAEVVVADLSDQPPPDPMDANVEPLPFQDDFRLEALTFVYPESSAEALRDVNLVVHRGESVGLVGSSGAGKTTLVDLVLGLLRPTSGRLVVDGEPVEGARLLAWRRTVGYVPQEVFLFDSTIRRNIAVALRDEEIDDDQIDRVLRLAQLSDLAASLPNGLDTELGERGVRLSGGQRQRIGIARALYRQPKLLVLDEATSALDGVTEAAITATVETLRGELTMLVIAHRLSTVRRCDRIVLLSQGSVEGTGTFDELAKDSQHFADLVRVAGLMPKPTMGRGNEGLN